jgi:energy-coupling factor transporter ATP-binding protein EcfA2
MLNELNQQAATPAEPAEPKAEPSNEAKALADIVAWSAACPEWQRDALRRLCTGAIRSADIDELTQLCESPFSKGQPLTLEHVRDAESADALVTLTAIEKVRHVNALAEGERLSFFQKAVTVVYGDNGSGKSGYIRILKKACRARSPRDEKVIPNIYGAALGTPQARIVFSENGQNRHHDWVLGSAAVPLLSSVSVFDSRTANVHVDETNNVAYKPFPMKLLEDLAQICQQIKQRLQEKVEALRQQTPTSILKPQCRPHTAVGKLFGNLVAVKSDTVKALAKMSADETMRLQALKADLAADPEKKARSLLALKSRVETGVAAITRMTEAASDTHVAKLHELRIACDAAAEAAAAAAQNVFADEKLPGIGGVAWRMLWEAARAYSMQAYPVEVFPFTEGEARCVLCQQTLDDDAAARLGRFEAFVKNESKRREDQALTDYNSAFSVPRAAIVPIKSISATIAAVRDELGDAVLGDEIRRVALIGRLRLRRALRDHQAALPAVLALPSVAVAAHTTRLAERASALQGDANSPERKALVKEHDELADREWLAGIETDVLLEIARRVKIAFLELVLKDTVTNSITLKSGEVAQTLVTNTLRAEFLKEINKLGVAGLAVELTKDSVKQGTPRFRLALLKKPDERLGDILSEGEHRCIAIAAFFAELATTESRSAIVFDDPVSSLDHLHREALAARFAAEGQRRQVIVFTHDIAFLFLLNEACREVGTDIGFRSITRGPDQAGFCQLNPPPNAQPVDKVIDSIEKQLANQKIQHERGDQAAWYITVRSLYEQLRTTWERAVEEAVAPVIKRLANKVATPGLAKVTAITLDDCKAMRAAFGRCSPKLHSGAESLNPRLPAPDAIQAEIDTLRKWVADLKARQDAVDDI